MKEYENERFEGVSLSGETLSDMSFTDCTFTDCNIEACRFEDCEFIDCVFVGCRLVGNKPERSSLSMAAFRDCILVSVNWLLWKPPNLIAQPFDCFEACSLRFCSFAEYNLSRFHFAGNDVTESVFSDCKMQKCDMNGCDLSGTEFIRCDMKSADLREATGYKIGIFTCELKGARFSSPEALLLLGELGIKLD